jgi:hypothetical protein
MQTEVITEFEQHLIDQINDNLNSRNTQLFDYPFNVRFIARKNNQRIVKLSIDELRLYREII